MALRAMDRFRELEMLAAMETAARPSVLDTNRSGRPFTEQAVAMPLNPNLNRALLEGFADLIRLQADRLQQSVIFALICMLVPTVIAVTVIGYAVLKPIY